MTGHDTRSHAAIQQPYGLTPAAFTLVELLVASAIALSVIGALATLFSIFSRTASDSQAVVELTSRMRSTANRLRQDLIGLTVPLRPPVNPELGAGYFELIEGPNTDFVRVSGATTVVITGTDSVLGDVDDILLFTTRSTGELFTGKYSTGQIASPVAEVAWFCRPAAVQPLPGLTLQNLYRRQLLVISHVGASPFHNTALPPGLSNQLPAGNTIPTVYNTYDISLRSDPVVATLVPNTLADLMRRENRFIPTMRTSGTSLFVPVLASGSSATGLVFDAASGREGEDVILDNVIGFDVRVFDPDAQPRASGPWPIYPNEQGYLTLSSSGALTATGTLPARGGFVDLGCLPASGLTILTGSGSLKSGLVKPTLTGTATYDTWSTHFEADGIDNDTSGKADQGIDGADDGGIAGLPDDAAENEVPPPYGRRIRAIEIRIRCFDPASRQIRQTTVRQQFAN